MANRIQKAWDDIMRWKKFFENLVSKGQISSDFLSSRTFKKEMLGKYNDLLSGSYKNPTPDERSMLRLVNRERRQLERTLYPNVFVRLTRNLFRLGAALVNIPFRAITKPMRTAQTERNIGRDLSRHGFGEMASGISERIRQGEHAIREKVSESPSPKEVIDYDLSLSHNGRGKHLFEGFSATLTTIDGKEKRSLSVEDSTGITKEQADGLLHGRPIHAGGDKWKIPDINDADALGNIRIREIRIADFDLEKSISGIPGLKITEEKLSETIRGLRNGKRMELPILVDKHARNIQLEAAPLQRGLNFFENNRKCSLDHILGKNEAKNKTVKVDMPRQKAGKAFKL